MITTLFRFLLTIFLIYKAFPETGILTTAILSLIAVQAELIAYELRKIKECNRIKTLKYIK